MNGEPTIRQGFLRDLLSGSANATMLLPDGASFFPPPHTITTYSRPPIWYTDGVALPAAGRTVSHSSFPDNLSYARNFLSKFVAPMNNNPLLVTTGPP